MYAYVVQNPWTKFDPLGLATLIDTDISTPKVSEKEANDYVKHAQEVVQKMDESAPSKSAKMEVSQSQWKAYEDHVSSWDGYRNSDNGGQFFRGAHMAMARAAVHVTNNPDTYGPLKDRLETWSMVAGVYSIAAPAISEYAAAYQLSKGTTTEFFTVQSVDDIARLKGGGIPWPSAANRSALGEGVYSFNNVGSADDYLGLLSSRGVNAEVQTFSVSKKSLNSFNQINVDALSSPQAFLSRYSRLYGGTPDHGLQYIQRGTNFGTEHFFDKSVMESLNFSIK